jgi:hypothetical protein
VCAAVLVIIRDSHKNQKNGLSDAGTFAACTANNAYLPASQKLTRGRDVLVWSAVEKNYFPPCDDLIIFFDSKFHF